jgi:hypothetical protein
MQATEKKFYYGSKFAMLIDTFEGVPIKKSSHYTIMKEKIISDYVGLKVLQNHFMFDVLNDKIIQLRESGIMQKLVDFSYSKANTTKEDPVPLSLNHLLIWFQFWAALLLISLFFFFFEFLVSKMSGICRKSKDDKMQRTRKKKRAKPSVNVRKIHRTNCKSRR